LEEKFAVAIKNGSDESDPYLRDCFVVSLLTMTEGLKLTIFTYKWGKCVKHVEKYLLESLAK